MEARGTRVAIPSSPRIRRVPSGNSFLLIDRNVRRASRVCAGPSPFQRSALRLNPDFESVLRRVFLQHLADDLVDRLLPLIRATRIDQRAFRRSAPQQFVALTIEDVHHERT